jgi:FKBP-type peptidyl-prolyl cis-trans isomerase FkpA
MLSRTTALILFGALLAGCGQGDEPAADASAAADCTPVAGLAERGLIVETLRGGYGRAACVGDTLTAHTTGWLYDENAENGRGEKFWSSYDGPGDPFDFVLGSRQVIQGWDLGMQGMLLGETRQLTIPGELAYGESGRAPLIPPNAALVFEIELLSAKGPGEE